MLRKSAITEVTPLLQAFKVLVQVPLAESGEYIAYRRAGEGLIQRLDDFQVFRTMFSWTPGETDILSSLNSRETELVEQHLVQNFAIDKSPESRGVAALQNVLDVFQKIDISDGHTWRSEAVATGDGDEIELSINPFAALGIQLAWLFEVFGDVPNAVIAVL